jgi:3D-(3,5/4)-trihydroxycyclohexane-1,2-dione acylhydrolase (decyclizing)
MKQQHVERDGIENPFFEGVLGIFGHGNVAGIGQALQQNPDFRYILTRNEQASVHMAIAHTKIHNRLSTWACTSSIGPGATNMITGAAAATINRLPVLLLPGDIFARRNVAPVLQQLEWGTTQDISVNDAFKPVSRYWDRINRPEQLIYALPEAMRVLTSPADTGAVTLALPQDVQAEAFDFPIEMFEKRIWHIARPRPDLLLLNRVAELIRRARKPVIIAGGGVIYSDATFELRQFAEQTGIPVTETFAGKGAMPWNHPLNLGATGVTGTPGANQFTDEADLVIGIGTRYSDFTTASKTAFQNPDVKFININIAEFDAYKQKALPVTCDAKICLAELKEKLTDVSTAPEYRNHVKSATSSWTNQITEITSVKGELPVRQAEVIGAVNDMVGKNDIMICAAGSLPGDLHKLWKAYNTKAFHLEYGYSTMGYEVAAGFGAKLAAPDREIWVMVGDGNYLMMNSEIATSIQEGVKFNIILLNNYGFGSIGALSESVGSQRFGTRYQTKDKENIKVDFAQNAASMGAHVISATTIESLKKAMAEAKEQTRTTVIVIETDLFEGVPGFAWWEVPVAEVSEIESVQKAYKNYKEKKKMQM